MRTLLKVLVIFVFYLTPFYLSAKPVDIALDQVGYRIDDEKDFRVARQVAAFQIRDEQNSIVFEGKLSGPIHDQYAGCDVWRGVFTDLKTPGTYTVQMEGGDRSWPFRIGNDIYQPLLQAALRGLYVSRCGYAVKDDAVGHPPCHMRDGAFMLVGGKKIADGRDATGGWHNGGDYWRSTMSAAQTVSRLLWPVEMFPDSFDNIPSRLLPKERCGDWPDLLTEARWGLEWLAKMQGADGGVSTGVGPYPARMPPMVPPQNDSTVHFIGAVHSSNTAKVGAVFARAARILKARDPAFARACLNHARSCWNYLLANSQPVTPRTCATYVKQEDETDRLWLAVELFRTTAEREFQEDFLKRFTRLQSSYPPAPVITHTIRNFNLHEALISYCFIRKDADQAVQQNILAGLQADCDRMVTTALTEGYGCVLTAENWKQRHTMGTALQMAWELVMAFELTGQVRYRDTSLQQLHFVLGANPLGKVFVTGVGSNPVRNPHYRPCSIKNQTPLGLLVKGPTYDEKFLACTLKQRPTPPPEKAYVDSSIAHQCNEPDIEVQGHLIGLSAYFYATGSRMLLNKASP